MSARATSPSGAPPLNDATLELLREAARRLPASIYRCKGVVFSADDPTRRVVLQVVGKRVDVKMETEWGDRVPGTQIVAIGAHGSIDAEALRERFDGRLATSR